MLGVFAGGRERSGDGEEDFLERILHISGILPDFPKSLEDILQSNWRMMNKKAEYGGKAIVPK